MPIEVASTTDAVDPARPLQRLPHQWRAGAQYALALGLVALSLLARWLLSDALGDGDPFSLTLGVLLPLVLLVRPGPFLAAVILGWTGALFLFVSPAMSFRLTTARDALMVSLYSAALALGVGAAWLSQRRAETRAREVEQAERVERARRESELTEQALAATTKFRSVFNQSGIFASITDPEGTVLEANELSLKACGYRAEEVVGLPFWETAWWRGSAQVRTTIRDATAQAAAGEVFHATLPYWVADGTERVVDFVMHPIRDESGRVMFLHPTGIDITERERAEVQLRRNHETFFNLVQNSPFGIYVVDSQFRLRQVGKGAQRVFEHVRPIIGRDFAEVLRAVWEEPFASEAIARFRHTLATGEPYVAIDTTEQRHDLGVVESYDWRIERITLPDGEFGVVCYFYDLSEIKRVQEELRYRGQQFQTLIDRAPLGVLLVDTDLRLVQVNPAGMPVFSEIADLIGRRLEEVMQVLWPAHRAAEIVGLFRHTLETGEPYHMPELEEVRLDRGVTEYYDWRMDRMTLPDGRTGVVCYFTNITHRKQAEESIRFQARLLDAIGQAVIVTDPAGIIIYWNRAAEDLYGWSRAEAVGRHVLETTVGPRVEQAAGIMEQVRAGQSWSGEFEVTCKGGTKTALVTNTPMFDEQGRLKAIIGISVDISEMKTIQTALEDADRRKDEFLATLAHELRNPLAAIRMALGVLGLSGSDPALLTRMRAIIDRQSAQLVRLIDDLLDVSRIARGKVELRKEPVNLAQVIEHAVEGIAGLCETKGVRLSVVPADQPIVTEADALRLAQVVSNLLNNAYKFTDSGGEITVSAAREGSHAVVRVRDTGAGIPAPDLARVFDMFAQVEGPSGGGGGLGIGLSLARSIVSLHRGSIEAHSDGLGRGSEFVVRVPARGPEAIAPEAATGEGQAEPEPAGERVLVVDDNRDALEAVAMMLQMAGYTVDTASVGSEAVEKARDYRPMAVLLDIGLPEMDGYEVARRIRKEPWGRDVRLIAMTGWGQEKDKRQALEAGFDAHLTKPVDAGELVRVLGR